MKTPFLMVLVLCAGTAIAQPVIKAVDIFILTRSGDGR